MTIRYVRQGLKVVRVPSEAPLPGARPEPLPSSRAAARIEDLAPRLRAFNAGILDDARRSGVAQRVAAAFPAEAIALARRRVGLTQRQLASKLGMSRSMLASCELRERTVPLHLARWAAGVFAEDAEP